MATVINITDKIKNEPKFVCYDGKQYKVDARKNTFLKVLAILNSPLGEGKTELDALTEVIEILYGKKAAKDFDGLDYDDYLVPFYAAMACIQNQTYEETEATFRNAVARAKQQLV